MKRIILGIISICISLNAWCDCASDGLYFWPNKAIVRENAIFSIVGYAESEKVVVELGKKYKIYLRSANDTVELKVDSIYYGQFSLTQAILRPSEQLIPGETYYLVIPNLPYSRSLITRYNTSLSTFEAVTWKVEAGKDTVQPKWTSVPVYKNDTWIEYGCGPEVAVNFKYAALDDSEYLVKATVKNLTSKKECTYYLNADKDIIRIGHGMCSGEFYLENGINFEVEFGLMDASGNEILWTGSPLKFKCPAKKGF